MEKLHIAFQDGATNITADWLNAMQGNVNELIDLAQGEGATIYIKGKANNNAYGSVSVFASKDMHCDTYPAKANEYVTLKANPASGYMFTAWNDGNTQNPRTVLATADGENEYTANFTSGQIQITVSCESKQGTVEVVGGPTVEMKSQVTIKAQAKSGYLFDKWVDAQGATVSTEAEYTFTAGNIDASYVAKFVVAPVGDVTVTMNEQGVIQSMTADEGDDIYYKLNGGAFEKYTAETGDIQLQSNNTFAAVAKNVNSEAMGDEPVVMATYDADENTITLTSDYDMVIDGSTVRTYTASVVAGLTINAECRGKVSTIKVIE